MGGFFHFNFTFHYPGIKSLFLTRQLCFAEERMFVLVSLVFSIAANDRLSRTFSARIHESERKTKTSSRIDSFRAGVI